MKIWRRIYREYGYSVVEVDMNDYVLETYDGMSIKDTNGDSHKVVNSTVDRDDEFVIIIE